MHVCWHDQATIACSRLTGSFTHSIIWNAMKNSTPHDWANWAHQSASYVHVQGLNTLFGTAPWHWLLHISVEEVHWHSETHIRYCKWQDSLLGWRFHNPWLLTLHLLLFRMLYSICVPGWPLKSLNLITAADSAATNQVQSYEMHSKKIISRIQGPQSDDLLKINILPAYWYFSSFLVAWQRPLNKSISSESCQIWMHQNILLWHCCTQTAGIRQEAGRRCSNYAYLIWYINTCNEWGIKWFQIKLQRVLSRTPGYTRQVHGVWDQCLILAPARRPEAGNFTVGPATSKTCRPCWQANLIPAMLSRMAFNCSWILAQQDFIQKLDI